ncbi:hypothetical protein BLA18110_07279 [Burkholderia lata]|nr:hypothetical protein BLA18110_07279 [Burkholderia lata]
MGQATSVRCVRLLPEQPGTTALIQSRDACRAVQRGLLAARISGDGERKLSGIPPPPLQMAFTQRAPVRCVGRRDCARRSSSDSTLRGLYKGHNAPSKTASPSASGPFPTRTRRTRLTTGSSPSPTGKVVRCVRAGSQSLLRAPAGDSRHGTTPPSSGAQRRSTARRIRSSRSRRTGRAPGRCRHDHHGIQHDRRAVCHSARLYRGRGTIMHAVGAIASARSDMPTVELLRLQHDARTASPKRKTP